MAENKPDEFYNDLGRIDQPDILSLQNCDREQVQFSGAIQPYGALLVLDPNSLTIISASANTYSLLAATWDSLVGSNIDSLLGEEQAQALRLQLMAKPVNTALAYLMTVSCLKSVNQPFHLFANATEGQLLLEFEAVEAIEPSVQTVSWQRLYSAMQCLQQTTSLSGFFAEALEQIQFFSGFERVMAYRFDTDGSGEVIAEIKPDALESYLSLHYPASDIPEPARRLFALSPLRHLPDVDYTPVPLLPETLEKTVNLSYANLRSVSVMYTGYLRNMGVKATLVMPLFKAGKLWGLIACQHSTPLYLSYEKRIPLELLSQMLSQWMLSREEQEQLAYKEQLNQVLDQLMVKMAKSESLQQALIQDDINLLTDFDAGGVAVLMDGKLVVLGKTPLQNQITLLIKWLAQQVEDIFTTDSLSKHFPFAQEFSDVASGLLAIRLSSKSQDWIIWFRAEILTEVNWAGNPDKPVEIDEFNGEIRLQPRTSFALWQQTVNARSRPWLECEQEYAIRLRNALFTIVVERAWLLAQINADLERSNLELDSFAYAASHDMKEPLRGIYNYVEFLKLEESEHLSPTGRQRLETILNLAERMVGFLDTLLQYSRIGKNKLEFSACNMNELIKETVTIINDAWQDNAINIEIQGSLPVINGDAVWVSRIFQNLLTNAIKYNQQPCKQIVIGCDTTQATPVFFVRDNGIGIAPEYHEKIFELFYHLHNREVFGSGSGAGLTIVRRAVERHGGRIWLESTLGQGSTFFFTLSPIKIKS